MPRCHRESSGSMADQSNIREPAKWNQKGWTRTQGGETHFACWAHGVTTSRTRNKLNPVRVCVRHVACTVSRGVHKRAEAKCPRRSVREDTSNSTASSCGLARTPRARARHGSAGCLPSTSTTWRSRRPSSVLATQSQPSPSRPPHSWMECGRHCSKRRGGAAAAAERKVGVEG